MIAWQQRLKRHTMMNGYPSSAGNSNQPFAAENSNAGDDGILGSEFLLVQDSLCSSLTSTTGMTAVTGSYSFANSQSVTVSHDNNYRENPIIDESTNMPYGSAMDLEDVDESSFLPTVPVSFSATTAAGSTNPEIISISNILSSSERIHIADESFPAVSSASSLSNYSSLESSQVKEADYGSPHKMSRVEPAETTFVNVEKLLNNENNQPSSNFKFMKFGTDFGGSVLNHSSNGSELATFTKTEDFGAIHSGHSTAQPSPSSLSNHVDVHSASAQFLSDYDQNTVQQQHLQPLEHQQLDIKLHQQVEQQHQQLEQHHQQQLEQQHHLQLEQQHHQQLEQQHQQLEHQHLQHEQQHHPQLEQHHQQLEQHHPQLEQHHQQLEQHIPIDLEQQLTQQHQDMDQLEQHVPTQQHVDQQLDQQQSTLHKLNVRNRACNSRAPQSLIQPLSDRYKDIILKIVQQPEAQHRARYMTEGSRGAIKDSLQRGHPVVQLIGWSQPANLEIFIGTDSGKVKPHCFYQACRINGKNASACKERDYEGTTVIEMEMDPEKKMTATIDCVGILKLRNTDVEKRVGGLKNKKKSTKCRLVLRTTIFHPDKGDFITLQTTSVPIACTQPAGLPEICRTSLSSDSVRGGAQLFAIGKNFIKGFQVKFQEIHSETGEVTWECQSEVDQEYIHTTHFICTVPAYKHEFISSPVDVCVVVETPSGSSDPTPFKYIPVSDDKAVSFPMSVTTESAVNPSDDNSPDTSPPSIVSPEALELVAQLQQQKFSDKEGKIFQIPEGVDFISSRDGSELNRNSSKE